MATTNLNLVEIAVGQSQKEVTHNQALQEIDDAIGTQVSLAIDNTNALIVTSAQLQDNFFLKLVDGSPVPTAAITITIPSGISRGSIAVINTTGFDATITIAAQTITAPVISAGQTAIVTVDVADVRGLEGGSSKFLTLTDTPNTFVGQGQKIATVNVGETALEFITNANILLNPGRPFIGALVNKTDVNQSAPASTTTKVTFNTTVYDTGFNGTPLFTNASDVFTIPAGVKRVRLTAGVQTATTANVLAFFSKNGVSFPGQAASDIPDTSGTEFISISSAVVDTVTGDTFELDVLFDATTDILLNINATYFSIEVLETTNDTFPAEEVSFFVNGTPAINDMIFLKVASIRFSVNDELLNSQTFVVTAPTVAAVAFDVQKNAVSIGTITFAVASNTATFTTSGSTQVNFDPGDRISIHSPANLQGMADIAFNIFAFRT